ncbi:lipase family protein [Williamsia phyllosphaerae]|uniref:Lipase n=1 Tax=Williamsia phyllosphaerae TaxID=885042 RepID=A0ABQ1UYM3_9NOCA|nr:lipase family protein [Williamsia phyllosphaerae]GGF28701.1 putative lipase [Williamsia phyllosphaerae]
MTGRLKAALAVIAVLIVAILAIGSFVLWPVISPSTPDLAVPGGSAPGAVVEATAKTDLPILMQISRAKGTVVEYMSTDPTGRPVQVSGVGFEPGGDAPEGGWPVVALAHGTVGIDDACAPSRSAELGGLIGIAQALVGAGYAVAVPDYQGLGSPGEHPYLDSPTAGRNVIDSIRAVRTVFGNVSNRWAGYGGSQGGGAIWAANEESARYAPELSPVGTVDAAPAADVVGLVAKARAGTLTSDQRAAMQLIIEAAARIDPAFVRDDYRTATAAAEWDVLSACSGPLVSRRDAAIAALGPGDVGPRSDAAAARLTELLRSYALPRMKASAPMLVLYGDADTFIDPEWTRDAVRRSCALGSVVESSDQPGKGHGDVDISSALGWLKDRFDGKPAPSNC